MRHKLALSRAEGALKLIALISDGYFEPYFAWHLQRERQRQRNHQAHYQDKLSLTA